MITAVCTLNGIRYRGTLPWDRLKCRLHLRVLTFNSHLQRCWSNGHQRYDVRHHWSSNTSQPQSWRPRLRLAAMYCFPNEQPAHWLLNKGPELLKAPRLPDVDKYTGMEHGNNKSGNLTINVQQNYPDLRDECTLILSVLLRMTNLIWDMYRIILYDMEDKDNQYVCYTVWWNVLTHKTNNIKLNQYIALCFNQNIISYENFP